MANWIGGQREAAYEFEEMRRAMENDSQRQAARLAEAAILTRNGNLEMLAAAFLKETGLAASECELVEEHTSTGMRWYFRKRPELRTKEEAMAEVHERIQRRARAALWNGRGASALQWHSREETPPAGQVWASDGKQVWIIFTDGKPIPKYAKAVLFWSDAGIPGVPRCAGETVRRALCPREVISESGERTYQWYDPPRPEDSEKVRQQMGLSSGSAAAPTEPDDDCCDAGVVLNAEQSRAFRKLFMAETSDCDEQLQREFSQLPIEKVLPWAFEKGHLAGMEMSSAPPSPPFICDRCHLPTEGGPLVSGQSKYCGPCADEVDPSRKVAAD